MAQRQPRLVLYGLQRQESLLLPSLANGSGAEGQKVLRKRIDYNQRRTVEGLCRRTGSRNQLEPILHAYRLNARTQPKHNRISSLEYRLSVLLHTVVLHYDSLKTLHRFITAACITEHVIEA